MNKQTNHKLSACESCGKFTNNLKWGMCRSCRPHMGAADVRIGGNRKSLRMLGGMIIDANSAREPMVVMHSAGGVA